MVPAGTLVVQTAQPLGTLAVGLLEPRSEDGLATWNFFDAGLKDGGDFPVVAAAPGRRRCHDRPAEPLAERPRPIAADHVRPGRRRRRRGGAAAADSAASRDGSTASTGSRSATGRLIKFDAATGRSQPFVDAKALAKGLARIPSLDAETAQSIAGETSFDMDPAKQGFLFEHGQDLYYATFDGATAVRLTNQPGREQWPQFSPDGKHGRVRPRFRPVRGRHRHPDRAPPDHRRARRPAPWPGRLGLLRGDLEPPLAGVLVEPRLEAARVHGVRRRGRPVITRSSMTPPAPRRGTRRPTIPARASRIPKVRLGIVGGMGGPVQWADLSDYSPDSFLISDVGWWPDSSAAYCYVQDRTQTWLDLVKFTPGDGEARSSVCSATRPRPGSTAPGRSTGYNDGIVPLAERARRLEAPLPLRRRRHAQGPAHVGDRGRSAGSSTSTPRTAGSTSRARATTRWRRTSTASSRAVRSNGSRRRAGSHTATMSPRRQALPVEPVRHPHAGPHPALSPRTASWSARSTPIRRTRSKRLRFGPRERVQIPTTDGFMLEAELILPPDLDPSKKYPVWFMTYGGPHTPTVSDSWAGGRMWDHALASEGFVVFRMDPRPASGKGAVSAWTAYKHLGVQELEDIKTAINWLKQKPYVDGSRIGMAAIATADTSPSYAMTHSDLFAAGIAGAPVTDWRDYDSIYTERYMGLPQDNPEGYNVSSVVQGRREAARQAADPARRDRRQRLVAEHHAVGPGPSGRQQGLRADDLSVVPPRDRRAALHADPARLHPAHAGRPEAAEAGSPGDLASDNPENSATSGSPAYRRRAAAEQ